MYVSQVVFFFRFSELNYVCGDDAVTCTYYYITIIPKSCTLREDHRIERQQIST